MCSITFSLTKRKTCFRAAASIVTRVTIRLWRLRTRANYCIAGNFLHEFVHLHFLSFMQTTVTFEVLLCSSSTCVQGLLFFFMVLAIKNVLFVSELLAINRLIVWHVLLRLWFRFVGFLPNFTDMV